MNLTSASPMNSSSSSYDNCSTNCSSDDVEHPPGHIPGMPAGLPTWFMVITMSTLSALSLTGNILAIFCFIRFRRKLKQNTVAYLISLAVSDLWIGFMTGCGILSLIYKRWVLGTFLCQSIAFLNNVALINSLWTVALGSVDRCFAIRVPFKHRSIMTKRRLALLIISTWGYASMLSLPPLLGFDRLRYAFHPSHPWCAISPKYSVKYFVIFSVGFLPFPVIIILSSYIVIFMTTRRYTKRQLDRLSSCRSVSSEGSEPMDLVHKDVLRRSKLSPHRPLTSTSSLTNFSSAADQITRLKDERPMSASYDTLKAKRSSWVAPPPAPPTPASTSLYKQIVGAIRKHLKRREPVTRSSSFVYRARKPMLNNCMSEEEAAARKLRHQAGTLLLVVGSTILVSYTPLLSISTLAAFNFKVESMISYKEVQGFILLMLSNASINPLIYFLLNKEFRLAAKSLFTESMFCLKIRRSVYADYNRVRSHTFSSQTLTMSDGGAASRPTSTSSYKLRHQTDQEQPSPYKHTAKHTAKHTDKENTSSSEVQLRPRPPLTRTKTEEQIQKHILRKSVVITEHLKNGAPSGNKKLFRASGLINFSFYEVESAI